MTSKVDQVVILAAGLGTRLKPITNNVPKVMLPIWNGRPLLEHTLLLLKRQGFRDFVVNLHYLPHKITEYFGDGRKLGVNISYSDETSELVDTAGAIKKVESRLSDRFLLVYGDELHFVDFRPIVEFHIRQDALCTLILKRSEGPQDGEVADLEIATGRIRAWHHRPHAIQSFSETLFLNSGLYVLSKKILDSVPRDRKVRLETEVLPTLVKKGSGVFGVPAKDDILDIGTQERYEFAKAWYLKNLHKSPLTDTAQS